MNKNLKTNKIRKKLNQLCRLRYREKVLDKLTLNWERDDVIKQVFLKQRPWRTNKREEKRLISVEKTIRKGLKDGKDAHWIRKKIYIKHSIRKIQSKKLKIIKWRFQRDLTNKSVLNQVEDWDKLLTESYNYSSFEEIIDDRNYYDKKAKNDVSNNKYSNEKIAKYKKMAGF